MMAESIWAAIDAHLVTQVTTAMGLSSAYNELQLETVLATAIQSRIDWENWTLPAVAVVGVRVRRNPGGHDGLTPHYDKEMPYRLVAIVEGTQSEVTAAAKRLEKRIEALLRAISFATVIADDTERVQNWRLENSDIAVLAKPGCENCWYGLAIVDLLIRTHI